MPLQGPRRVGTFTPSAVQTAETREYPRPHPSTNPRPFLFFSSSPTEHLCAKQHNTNCGATPTDSNHRTKPVLARPSSSSKGSPRHVESSLRPHDPFQASTPLFPPPPRLSRSHRRRVRSPTLNLGPFRPGAPALLLGDKPRHALSKGITILCTPSRFSALGSS